VSDNLAQSGNIYEQLGVLKDTPAQEIHKRFIKLIIKLLQDMSIGGQIDDHLQRLQGLWFAHDILVDPATRTDYDLRALGIQTASGNFEIVDDDTLNAGSTQQSPPASSWRIGELLQAAGLLEQAELDIACDMHKAMSEMQFGGFLIKHEFIDERQLQAVLIGQILLRSGDITLSQFCEIMAEAAKSKRDVKEILLEKGHISKTILKKFGSELG